MNGKKLCAELTEKTDRIIEGLTTDLASDTRLKWCIVAVGGYGRRELCPFSDIDLLILSDSKARQQEFSKALQNMLYPLWDLKYTVGYSVRTIKQAVNDTRDDFFFRTSLLDARYLCGSRSMFDELMSSCSKDRYLRDTGKFLRYLDAHIQKRHDKYGDASYNLEPDIKEGMGSLRDYHCLMWIRKAASCNPDMNPSLLHLNDMDAREIEEAADNLITIRYHLHKLAGRKADRLSFDYQSPLAEKLGYRGNGNETASELLMRSFHCSALSIKSVAGALMAKLNAAFNSRRSMRPRLLNQSYLFADGLISFERPDDVPARPDLVIGIFASMSEHGGTLSFEARDLVRKSLNEGEPAWLAPSSTDMFLRILMGRHCLDALSAMLETGVLERFMPEFKSIKGRTQVDIYHTYTTDLHTIRTIHELHALRREEHDAFKLIKDHETLYLAAFLHDIGKGAGKPHAAIGAQISRRIASRMGFPEKNADMISFLVRNHLLLPDTAYRSDLSEEKVALDCARTARDEQTLSMLYLLSIADSRATGPRAWDDWKSRLLKELYIKALHSLQRGVLRDPQTMIILEERWSSLIREMPAESGQRRGGGLWVLPQAYVIHTPTDLIKRHLRLSAQIKGPQDIALDLSDRGDHARLTIITKDRPGLFALLAGILTINHLDILSAQVFTWINAIAVDTFHVVVPWKDYTGWDRIREHFTAASTGRMDIGQSIATAKPLLTEPTIQSSTRPGITLDNDSSDFFTLISVRSRRSHSLLYKIACSLSSLKLNIHRAFLSHTGDPCTDVFYVVDELGEKILDEGTIHEVERELLLQIYG